MGWNWLASVRQYLPSLPTYKEYDHFSAGKAALAQALSNRSCVFLKESEYDLAIADCNRAIEYKPDFAHAFCNRGTAYLGKGDRERAISDYDRAINLKPDFALPFSNRGFAYFSEGNVGQAFRDYDRAIELEPDLDVALRCRAVTALCQRRFTLAQKDLAEAVRVSPKDLDNIVWLYLVSVRDGHADKTQLEGQIAGRDLKKWPALGVQFLLGSLSGEALLATCADENSYTQREQLCAAHFLIGHGALLDGDLVRAASSFSKAVETQATNCLEFVVAEAELRFLNLS